METLRGTPWVAGTSELFVAPTRVRELRVLVDVGVGGWQIAIYLETSGMEEFHVRWFSPGVAAAGLSELSGAYPGWGEDT